MNALHPLRAGLAALALVVAGCPSTPDLEGSYTDGVYRAPLGHFELRRPLGEGLGFAVQDDLRQLPGLSPEGLVTFTNDFGQVRRVDYTVLPDALRATSRDRAWRTDKVREAFQQLVVPQLEAEFVGSRVLHEEATTAQEEPAYFGVVHIPGGSTLVEANGLGLGRGARLDDVRAFLVVVGSECLYIVSSSLGLVGEDASAHAADGARLARWRETVDEIWNALEFRER